MLAKSFCDEVEMWSKSILVCLGKSIHLTHCRAKRHRSYDNMTKRKRKKPQKSLVHYPTVTHLHENRRVCFVFSVVTHSLFSASSVHVTSVLLSFSLPSVLLSKFLGKNFTPEHLLIPHCLPHGPRSTSFEFIR